MRALLVAGLVAYVLPARAQIDPERLSQQAFARFQGAPADRQGALEAIVMSGRADAAPILILALRFAPSEYDAKLVKALATLTGASRGNDWAAWMRWQEVHPEIGVTGTIADYRQVAATD